MSESKTDLDLCRAFDGFLEGAGHDCTRAGQGDLARNGDGTVGNSRNRLIAEAMVLNNRCKPSIKMERIVQQ